MSRAPSPWSNFRASPPLGRISCARLPCSPGSLLSLRKPPACFLALSLCLLCWFHINGIKQRRLLFLATFHLADVFEVHPCCSVSSVVSLYWWIIFHWMVIPLFFLLRRIGIWKIFRFWLLRGMLCSTCTHQPSCECKFSFLLAR